ASSAEGGGVGTGVDRTTGRAQAAKSTAATIGARILMSVQVRVGGAMASWYRHSGPGRGTASSTLRPRGVAGPLRAVSAPGTRFPGTGHDGTPPHRVASAQLRSTNRHGLQRPAGILFPARGVTRPPPPPPARAHALLRPGPPLRDALPPPDPGVHRGRGAHPRARHRRDDGHLHGDRAGAAGPAPLP